MSFGTYFLDVFDQCLALLLITCATIPSATLGIQVRETVANDVTTTATTLLPTPLTTISAESNEMRLGDNDSDDNDDSMEDTIPVTISLPIHRESNTEVPAASTNAAIPPTTISTTKMPRIEKGSGSAFRASAPIPAAAVARDQQPRSTVNVAQHTSSKQFVPSPQLSPVTFPPVSSAENGRESIGGQLPLNGYHYNYPAWGTQQPHFSAGATAFPPTSTTTAAAVSNKYSHYKATQDNLIYGDAADREPWRLSTGPLSSPPASPSPAYQYPISANGGGGGRWYWMPNSATATSEAPMPFGTTISTPFASDSAAVQPPPQHWRWFVDQKFGTNANGNGADSSVGPSGPEAPPLYSTVATYRPGAAEFPRIEHPYSFDSPGGTVIYQNMNGHKMVTQGLNGGEQPGGNVFATEITESEWEHWVKNRPSVSGPGEVQIIPATKGPPKERPKGYVLMLACSIIN